MLLQKQNIYKPGLTFGTKSLNVEKKKKLKVQPSAVVTISCNKVAKYSVRLHFVSEFVFCKSLETKASDIVLIS